MRLALAALVVALPAMSAAEAPVPPTASRAALAAICGSELKLRPIRDGARAKRLGELPPGELTLTVVDRVGDCIEPRLVGQGYGALEARKKR